ncbi:hypothetical protein EQV77_06730 [Halobacillus fulvus]|nr:hypothetical protein EQV77_06730 [Halobacillus fulvus]
MNSIISGVMVILISTFFAGGTIAENYTDKTWVAPEFFVIIPLWAIGFLLGLLIYRGKFPGLYLLFSILLTWGAIPMGVRLGAMMAT